MVVVVICDYGYSGDGDCDGGCSGGNCSPIIGRDFLVFPLYQVQVVLR